MRYGRGMDIFLQHWARCPSHCGRSCTEAGAGWPTQLSGEFFRSSFFLSRVECFDKVLLGNSFFDQEFFRSFFLFSRVECFDKVRSEQCCQSVRLRWQSSVKTNLVAFNPKRISKSWLQSWTCIVQVRRFDRCFPFLLVGRLHHGRLQQRGQYHA